MIRTLVVDDDFRVAALHGDYVARLPEFETIGRALTGEQAVAQTASLRPDLVLLDVYLPDRSGLEVAKEIRRLDEPQPDLVFITAARDVDTVRTAIRDGALNYLVKPFTFSTFQEKMLQYRDWTARVAAAEAADQDTVDRLYGALRPAAPGSRLPKGLSEPTLQLVLEAVRELEGPVSAHHVARAAGVSRATARRYLEHLVETGHVDRRLRYGTAGRPEHRFALATVGG